jgi:hypothetical protein
MDETEIKAFDSLTEERDRLHAALYEWWFRRRPIGWTEAQHKAAPFISPDGIACGLEKRMIRALLNLPEVAE